MEGQPTCPLVFGVINISDSRLMIDSLLVLVQNKDFVDIQAYNIIFFFFFQGAVPESYLLLIIKKIR